MSIEVEEGKKRLTKAEANYLFKRPWMTSKSERDQLRKMLAPKKASESEDDSGDDNNEE